MRAFPRLLALRLFRLVQTLWAVAMLGYAAMLVARSTSGTVALVVCAILLYCAATVGIYWDKRWAWAVSLAWLALYWAVFGWAGAITVAVNLIMFAYSFLTGRGLYADSPATIIIVAIRVLFAVAPSTALLVLGIVARQELRRVLRADSGKAAEDSCYE